MKVELDRLNKLLHQSRVRSHSWQDRLLRPRGSSTCTHTCSPTVQLLAFHQVFVYNFFEVERFRWEGQAALTGGKHTVMFDFKYDGPGFGKGGTGVLSVDGKEVASKTIPHTMPFLETIDETFERYAPARS
jgi:hypothetical protein